MYHKHSLKVVFSQINTIPATHLLFNWILNKLKWAKSLVNLYFSYSSKIHIFSSLLKHGCRGWSLWYRGNYPEKRRGWLQDLGRLKTEGQYRWQHIIRPYAVTPSGVKPHLISLTSPLSDYQTSKLCPDWFTVAAGIWGALILLWYSQGQTKLLWSWADITNPDKVACLKT